jgi:hypothetical protein
VSDQREMLADTLRELANAIKAVARPADHGPARALSEYLVKFAEAEKIDPLWPLPIPRMLGLDRTHAADVARLLNDALSARPSAAVREYERGVGTFDVLDRAVRAPLEP